MSLHYANPTEEESGSMTARGLPAAPALENAGAPRSMAKPSLFGHNLVNCEGWRENLLAIAIFNDQIPSG